jgi:DNA polymerase-1
MAAASEPRKRLWLVDGSGYVFRAFHALPPLSRKRDGLPTGAVSGFCNMLNKLLEDARASEEMDYFAVIFDAGRTTFRNAIYADYKANRTEPPDDLIPQFPLVREASRAFNLPTIEVEGYEADDLIATYARLAREQGVCVTIVSSDKDLMQLVHGDDVRMLDPIKNRTIGVPEVIERFGVPPEKVVDVQALCGDPTDNVPGVPGIGVKTAAELINAYGDLDSLLARAQENKQPKRRENLLANADKARLSRELVRLDANAPAPEPIEQLAMRDWDDEALFSFLTEMELVKLAERLRAKRNGREPAVAAVKIAAPEPEAAAPELVRDEAALARWIDAAQQAGAVAVQIRATAPDAMQAELAGVAFSLSTGASCYVPVGHRGGPGGLDFAAPDQLRLEVAVAHLKPLFENPAVLKIGQNVKFDLVLLARHGVRVVAFDDVMLMSYAVGGGAHAHDMAEMARVHIGPEAAPKSAKEGVGSGRNFTSFDQLPLDQATEFAGRDAQLTFRLHRTLKRRLVADRAVAVYETLERPLVPVLAEMERAGIRVDRGELGRLSQDFGQRIVSLEEEVWKLAGERFNIGSPKQLGEILFDRMSLPGGRKTKTGAYGTDASVLEELAAQGHDLPARVLDWRQLSKLKSTYTDALQHEIHPETGRIHTCYQLAATTTGRLSSTEPNLQNIPIRTEEGRRIRRAFVAEPGWKLVSADYSQIELRVLAHMADIEALKKAFREGVDIHALTASQVFGVPIEGMDASTRRSAKAINFGIIYGISAFGLANNLGIPQAEAQTYIRAYFDRYPGIRDYMERTKEACRHAGYVTTIFGRKVHVPGIRDANPARRAFQERAAINAPIQGSAADIIRRALVRMPSALVKSGLKARMLLQVHDELVFEAPSEEVEVLSAVAKRVMEAAAQLHVPLVVDAGAGDNWEEAH